MITEEIKSKVYAQYIGSKMMSGYILAGVQFSDTEQRPLLLTKNENTSLIDWEANFEMEKLILKSLDTISYEDANELIKLKGYLIPDVLEKNAIYIRCWTYKNINNTFKSLVRIDFNDLNLKQGQYLLSKGYDLPQYLLGGKTLKEAELAVYQ